MVFLAYNASLKYRCSNLAVFECKHGVDALLSVDIFKAFCQVFCAIHCKSIRNYKLKRVDELKMTASAMLQHTWSQDCMHDLCTVTACVEMI